MSRRNILVVDDEQHILDVVVYILEENAFSVITAQDGDRALEDFERHAPDLVILDLNLPGMGGLDLFRELRRRRPGTPIIMLTSKSEEVDRVVGLELGADDYVTKPFSPRELAARVRAVLRRTTEMTPRNPAEPRLTHGPLEVDRASFSLRYFGRELTLTPGEFRFIESLVRHPARVFTRDMLIETMYEGGHPVTDRSVDAHVKRIRRKFADIRADLDPIETVHGLGYKLSRELERAH